MTIGEMRERPLIKAASEAVDSAGGVVKTWAADTTVSTDGYLWAKAEFISGRELENAKRINGEISLKFTVRYNTALTTQHRAVWRSKNWNIHAVLPDPQLEFTALMASEVK